MSHVHNSKSQQEKPNTPQKASDGFMFSRFLGGAFSLGLANLLSTFLGLATIIFVVRKLVPDDFGVFVLLQVGASFLAEVSAFGQTLAIPKFIASASEKQTQSDLIQTVIYFRILTVVFVIIVALALSPFLDPFIKSPLLRSLLIYAPLLFVFESLGKTFTCVLQGLFHFGEIAISNFLASFLNLVFTAIFVLLLNQGVFGVMYAKLLSSLIAYAYAYFLIPSQKGGKFHMRLLKQMLTFGFPLQFQYILDFSYSRLDTFLIGALLGPAGVAYYAVAQKIPQSLGGLYEAFLSVYLPFFANLSARGEDKKLINLLNNSTRWLALVTISGALAALLFGREIIEFLFSQNYLPCVPAFILLMIGWNLNSVENTLGYSLVAIGETNKTLTVNAIRAVFSLLANLLFIPLLGFNGAALAKVIGNMVAIPLDILFLYRKKIMAGILDFLKPILIFGACAMVFLLLGASLVWIKIGIMFLFAALCVLTSVITIKDFTFILWQFNALFFQMLRKFQPEPVASEDHY